MFYYDKYGNPTDKPAMKKSVPAGVTAKSVLENYIKAIGGEKAVGAVKTISNVSAGEIQGTQLELLTKSVIGSKFVFEMKGMGMTFVKQVINDKTGYMTQQGQRKDLDAEKIADIKANGMPFSELNLLKDTSITLDGIEAFNGADAYVIKSGKSTIYFDVTSGLKIAKATVQEAGGQKVTQTMTYGDYKEVKGVKVPYKTTLSLGPQEIEFMSSEVKINEGVEDADFQ